MADKEDSRTWQIVFLWVLAIIAASNIVLLLFCVFISPITVDEGWYHHLAWAKNTSGFYQIPAFADIPALQGEYMFGSSLLIQIYRLFDFLFTNAVTSIIFIRFLFLAMFILSAWYYLKKTKPDWSAQRNGITIVVLLGCPLLLGSVKMARPELLVSALLCMVVVLLHHRRDNQLTRYIALFLSYIIFLLHMNGILYLLLIVILCSDWKKPWKNAGYWFFAFILLLGFYLVRIDYNRELYTSQFSILFNSGNEEKFLHSIRELPKYLVAEFTRRYYESFQPGANLLRWGYELVLRLGLFVFGTVILWKKTSSRMEAILVGSTMVFFVLLGNKTALYLTYLIPFLMIGILSYFDTNRRLYTILITLLLLFNTLFLVKITKFNVIQNQNQRTTISLVEQYVPEHATLYAPFAFAPYLEEKYHYLTTTQKDKNSLYSRFNIHPIDCYILAPETNEIWNHASTPQQQLALYKDMALRKVQ